MSKKEIRPHKGGRSIRKSTDVTPEVDKMLAHLWQQHSISLGDIVAEAAKVRYQTVTSNNNLRPSAIKDTIYLQIVGDDGNPLHWVERTHSEQAINDSDIKYVRSS